MRWEDITMDILEVGWGGMDWIDLVQDRDKWREKKFGFHEMRVIS